MSPLKNCFIQFRLFSYVLLVFDITICLSLSYVNSTVGLMNFLFWCLSTWYFVHHLLNWWCSVVGPYFVFMLWDLYHLLKLLTFMGCYQKICLLTLQSSFMIQGQSVGIRKAADVSKCLSVSIIWAFHVFIFPVSASVSIGDAFHVFLL